MQKLLFIPHFPSCTALANNIAVLRLQSNHPPDETYSALLQAHMFLNLKIISYNVCIPKQCLLEVLKICLIPQQKLQFCQDQVQLFQLLAKALLNFIAED